MNFTIYEPRDIQLKKYIEYFFHVNHDQTDNTFHMFPNGKSNIAICLEGLFSTYDNVGTKITLPRSVLSASCCSFHPLTSLGNVDIMGVQLHTYGIYPFIGNQISIVKDKLIDLENLWGKDFKSEVNVMKGVNDIHQRISILENYLLRNIKYDIPSELMEVVTIINNFKGNLTLEELFKNVKINERTLRNYFQKYLGISFKKLCRYTRFQSALEIYKHSTLPSIVDIAYELEYFDQSHFIREFKNFTGLRPKEYFNPNQKNRFYDYKINNS